MTSSAFAHIISVSKELQKKIRSRLSTPRTIQSPNKLHLSQVHLDEAVNHFKTGITIPCLRDRLKYFQLSSTSILQIEAANMHGSQQLVDWWAAKLRATLQDILEKRMFDSQRLISCSARIVIAFRLYCNNSLENRAVRVLEFIKTRITTLQQQVIPQRKTSFNHEFTPYLIKYYHLVQYPSAADRKFMAEKSGMLVEQINTWFQNHRSRSKREGSNPRKNKAILFSPEVQAIRVEMASYIRQNRESVINIDEEYAFRSAPFKPVDIVVSSPPPHAFPAPYTPSSYSGWETQKMPTPWLRTPATLPIEYPPANFEELTELFNGVSLDGQVAPTPSQPPMVLPILPSQCPLPAPHPALVTNRRARRFRPYQPDADGLSLKAISASESLKQDVFRYPFESLVPKSARKIAGLPKHMPSSQSMRSSSSSDSDSDSDSIFSRSSSESTLISSTSSIDLLPSPGASAGDPSADMFHTFPGQFHDSGLSFDITTELQKQNWDELLNQSFTDMSKEFDGISSVLTEQSQPDFRRTCNFAFPSLISLT